MTGIHDDMTTTIEVRQNGQHQLVPVDPKILPTNDTRVGYDVVCIQMNIVLEYCIQVWSPYLRKDRDMLEKIQRRVIKLIPGLRDLTYEERLKECGLTTLETCRLRGDQNN